MRNILGTLLLVFASGALICGCGNKEADPESAAPVTPKQAATQLEKVFVSAPPEVKTTVNDATAALQAANYDRALQSLQTVQARRNLTMEQGMAVHNSMVALEATLMQKAAAGDPAAIKAYERLRQSRRN